MPAGYDYREPDVEEGESSYYEVTFKRRIIGTITKRRGTNDWLGHAIRDSSTKLGEFEEVLMFLVESDVKFRKKPA